MARKLAIYGTGGAARDVLGPLREQLGRNAGRAAECEIQFVDDAPDVIGTRILDTAVMSFEQAINDRCAFVIAISDAQVRRQKAELIASRGCEFFSIVAPSALQYDDVQIGPGHILSDYVLVTTQVRIGAHFHANYYSHISHDCVIGDYVTFAPKVSCNGNVTIGDDVYIGTGAILKQGIRIGSGATIGMGAVVTKDVAAGATVIGNPAQPVT